MTTVNTKCPQVSDILFHFPIAPSPTSAIRYLATKCINRHRVHGWLMPWGSNRCQQVNSFDEPLAKTLDANDIVFAVHIPLPNTQMSPWFQFILAVLQFDIAFKMINQIGKLSEMKIVQIHAIISCGELSRLPVCLYRRGRYHHY